MLTSGRTAVVRPYVRKFKQKQAQKEHFLTKIVGV